jgi:outer membrane protein assembly factor BamB
VVGSGGIVYAGNLSNAAANGIVAFDTVNKSVRWSASGGFSGNPAYADGYLFAANNATNKMEVRRESDGGIEWSWAAPATDPTFDSDVLLTKNLVFVSTTTTTYAIDRTTHAMVWSYQAAGKLALSANGILYIKGTSKIVAINLK